MAKQQFYILPLLWLALLSSPMLYAATCPQDSIITYDENYNPIAKTIYQYDEAGRTILDETIRLTDGEIVYGSKITKEFYSNGKTKSTASWQWSNDAKNWIGIEKTYYEYNSYGSIALNAEYEWSEEINTWANKKKVEYTFNSNLKQTGNTTFVGDGTLWIPSTKQEYDYDEKNNKILDRYWSEYDAVSHTWIGKSWKVWEYKSDTYKSGITLYEEYDWQNGNWNGKTKYDAVYEKTGRTIEKISYANYDPITYTWDYSTHVKYAYDQWGNTTLNETYTWSDDHWKGNSKTEVEYNTEGIQLMKAIYSWDDVNHKWIGTEKSKTLYDEQNNIILDEQYIWLGNDWAGTKKEEMIYDDAKNIISKKTYQWQSTQWIYATKDSSAFDANKNKILEEHYTWNTSESYWVGTGEKHVSEYTNNMETLQEVYIWNTEGKDWTYKSKIIKEFDGTKLTLDEEYALKGDVLEGTKKEKYAYNSKGEPVMTVKYTWLHDEVWQGKDSVLANYDNNKNQTLNEQYTWEVEATETGGYWKGSEKATYTFNKNKQQTSSWVYSWDDTNRQWIYTSRDTSSYDSKKNLTLDERYTYDVTNQAWVGTLKKEYAYNTKGQQTMFAYYAWDETTSRFIGTQKEENEMDDAGRTILHASYTWNDTDWKGKSKDTYTYFRNDTVADHITFTWKSSKWTENKKTTDSYSDAGQHTATANFTWNTTSQSWLGVKQTTWEYTTTGKVATEIVSTWGTTDWVNSTKLENTYTEEVLTAYVNSKWESNAWLNVSKWEQTDPNTDCTYEWWNSAWSKTQENKKTYDGDNRLILESKQNWQQGVPTAGSKSVYVYTGSHMTLQSDSVYSISLTQWLETKRVTNAYDANDQQTLAMTQVFENGTQTSGDKTTHTYNGEGLQTNITISTWAGSNWLYVSKVDNEYVGKSVTTTSYVWDVSIPNWQGVEKDEKIYSNELDYTSTKSEWRNGAWFGISKTGYTFYENGKEHTIVDYLWSSSTWVEDFMTEYAYSGANNKVTATYTYQEGKWVGQTKEGVYYDEYEDLTTATWEWKNNAWSPQSKLGQSLYDDGQTKSKTNYKVSGNDFVYTTRVEYAYGGTAKDVTTANYTWDGAAWKGISKSGEVWDGSKISSKITYTWTGGFTWQYNQKTEYEYGSHQSDLTTAIYTWDNTIPNWVGVSKSGKTYASTGKQASDFSYTWGTTAAGNTDWLPVSKTEWEYGSGKDNAVATYKGVDTAWVGISKYAEQYTEHGDSLGFYTYCWKDGSWADSLKQTFEYDDQGNTIYHIYAEWKNGDWARLTTSKWWEINYDENGNVLVDAHYKWSGTKWNGTGSRYLYEYDENGLVILSEKDTWSSGKWVGSSKQNYTYNELGLLTLSQFWQWDKTKRKWKGISMNEYGYLSNGTKTMTAIYTWNASRGDWEGLTKSETIYDNNGNVLGSCQYSWSYSLWTWAGLFKFEYTYDMQGQIIDQITSRYSTEWYYDTKTHYDYDATHGKIATSTYVWSNNDWVLSTLSNTQYDEDTENKQRISLDAQWNTDSSIKAYSEKTYYYACDPKCTITVNTKEDGVGEVSGGGIYTYYARPQISAIETPNCNIFNQWTDGETSDKRRILVIEDKTYTAEFTSIEHTITTTVKDNRGGSAIISK